MAVAIVATALSVAGPVEGDLGRYLSSLRLDRKLRLDATREAKDEDLLKHWAKWFTGAEAWFRELCRSR